VLKEIIWFTLGFAIGKQAMTPEVKSAVSKGTEKLAEMAQQRADYIKEKLGQSNKDQRNEILFRKFYL
jgi:hypothetical protein